MVFKLTALAHELLQCYQLEDASERKESRASVTNWCSDNSNFSVARPVFFNKISLNR